MHIHHLNCGSMHPYGLPDRDGRGHPLRRGHGVIHCLLVETWAGLVLVDTGWGTSDYTQPSPPQRHFQYFVRCPLDPAETALHQLAALGYNPADLRHIFLTHLHLDHAGGLPDFPQAKVHLLATELQAARYSHSLMERYAYRPEHWAHGPRWRPHTLHGDRWFGLESTPPIPIGEIEFRLVPLTGHTRGHCAIALNTGNGWLLHCGDAYGYHRQASTRQPYFHPNGRLIETLVTRGFNMPRHHWRTLRDLQHRHPGQVRLFCAHDAFEFDLFRNHQSAIRN
jgi:glyoxylase-like metal-dependent hydrolase (beta-lactamase superfamily II)